jgi:hypothetical protein
MIPITPIILETTSFIFLLFFYVFLQIFLANQRYRLTLYPPFYLSFNNIVLNVFKTYLNVLT